MIYDIRFPDDDVRRIYTSFATAHLVVTRLYICDHSECLALRSSFCYVAYHQAVSELVIAAEEAVSDISLWAPSGDIAVLAQGTLNCIRALGGYTLAQSAETAFDTDTYKESEYLAQIEALGTIKVAMNWYVCSGGLCMSICSPVLVGTTRSRYAL